jgi:hypothetical protein
VRQQGIRLFPCNGLNRSPDGLHYITAQVFSGPNATGAASEELYTYLGFLYRESPNGGLMLYNADTDTEMESLRDCTINITETPRVAVLVNAFGAHYVWGPQSTRMVLDNRRVVVDNSWPFAFPGDRTTFYGPGDYTTDYLPFTLKPGPHTLRATLYKKKNLKSASVTWEVSFTVVK